MSSVLIGDDWSVELGQTCAAARNGKKWLKIKVSRVFRKFLYNSVHFDVAFYKNMCIIKLDKMKPCTLQKGPKRYG